MRRNIYLDNRIICLIETIKLDIKKKSDYMRRNSLWKMMRHF